MEKLGSYCLTEPSSGSDAAALRTTAKLEGDHYVLNGTKQFTTGGGVNDYYVVMVRTGQDGPKGISCVVVEKEWEGVSFGAPERKLGWNASPTAQVIFDNVRVPVENRVGEEGDGFKFAMAGLDGGRLNIGACSLGGAQRCLDEAVQYVKDRSQFGKPIADFQNTQFTLADMATDLEAARALLYLAAAKVTAGAPDKTRFAAMAKKLGMGIRHDLPLPAVSEGLMPDRAWKKENRGESWTTGDSFNYGIGQGFTLASPLHLALMTARVSTGLAVMPRLVRAIGDEEIPVPPPESLGIDPAHLAAVRDGMYNVSNTPGATAFRSRIAQKDMEMAGKTGTSQVRIITAAERAAGVTKNEQLPWNRRDHALFVAYAPYDQPRYAIAQIVEHGGGGSKVAAPIARDILLQALYGGTPPLEAYPSEQRREIEERRKAAQEAAEAAAGRPPEGDPA